jgi:hypothetical protein
LPSWALAESGEALDPRPAKEALVGCRGTAAGERKSIGIIQYLGQDGRLSRARHSAASGTPALCGISQRLVTHAGIAHHWGAVKCGLLEPRDCEPCSLTRPAPPGLDLDRASNLSAGEEDVDTEVRRCHQVRPRREAAQHREPGGGTSVGPICGKVAEVQVGRGEQIVLDQRRL